MCGICGIISLNNELLNEATQVVETMNKTIFHRGPDGSGIHDGGSYCFGHTRLSIVDLSEAGHQPMNYNDRYTITYNGEVYNYIELRSELEAEGYCFDSNTDTEVIMASYDFWGAECIKKFNGMWAFVIYDSQKSKFFISRDRFGIKPLYFTKTDGLFIFASEIKSILAHPEIHAIPNQKYIEHYIDNGPNEFSELTAFDHIKRFPFAHCFEGHANELKCNFALKRYWRFYPNEDNESFSKTKARKYANEYYDLLSDAVRLRLRSDVKVGSALSGGLDSSSIVYLVNQHLKNKGNVKHQNTFSTVYKSKDLNYCDESNYINLLADELKVKSWQIEPNTKDVIEEHKKMIVALENPPESSLMSSWHTYIEVKRRNVTVTLDGQGADEQLAGYVPFIRSHLLSLKLLDFMKECFCFFLQPTFRKEVVRTFLLKVLLLILGKKVLLKFFSKYRGWNLKICLNSTLKNSFETTLVNLLHYADHTSMAHGIESRMPFMDFRLVEFLATVPSCYKIHNGWTKYIARLAFDGKLPDKVVWRRDKMGWPTPDEVWFGVKFRSKVSDSLRNSKLLKLICSKAECHNQSVLLLRKYNISIMEKIFFK